MSILRLIVVTDSPPPYRHLDQLLDSLQQIRSVQLTCLVTPATDTAKPLRAATTTATARLIQWAGSLLFVLEATVLRTASRASRGLAQRVHGLGTGRSDTGKRFAQTMTLDVGEPLRLPVQPDLVLILGHWIPDGAAIFGSVADVIQVRIGDSVAGGLPLIGFLESDAGADQTPIRLFRIDAANPSGSLLIDGRTRTKPLFSLNQVACWDRLASLLQALLAGPTDGGFARPASIPLAPASLPVEQAAGLAGRLLTYPARVLARGVGFAAQYARGARRWSIAIHRSGPSWDDYGQPAKIEQPPRGGYHADPMLYWHESSNTAYCFVEEFDQEAGKAHIAVLKEGPSGWLRLGVALEEPFHLSFPFLFEHAGILYMCPECSESRTITVYRCADFPMRWVPTAVLMSDVSAADTMIFPRQGRWWMLTNIDRGAFPDHQSELHVFHAESPLSGNWQQVPGNPVKLDSRGARNGGLGLVGDRIFRFGQVQAFGAYGAGLHLYEIMKLDIDGFEERLIRKITPPARSGAVGIHTFSTIAGYVAVDLLGARPGAGD